MNTCLRCGHSLPLELFGLTKTGNHRSWCNPCSAAYKRDWKKTERGRESERRERAKNGAARQKKWKEKNPARSTEISRNAMKRYYARNKKAILKKNREFRGKHPEVQQAGYLVRALLFFGLMCRRPCESCSATAAHAHHPDHWKPLSIVWLCSSCHAQLGPTLRDPATVVVPRRETRSDEAPPADSPDNDEADKEPL